MTGGAMMNSDDRARLKAANRRTGLLLFAIALLFFCGIIASRFIDNPLVSSGVVGGAVMLYLIVAIGRHLRK
jgi:ABC-type Fe3+-siderophore transport system permease subunit